MPTLIKSLVDLQKKLSTLFRTRQNKNKKKEYKTCTPFYIIKKTYTCKALLPVASKAASFTASAYVGCG